VINLDIKISSHYKDIIQKYTNMLFQNTSFDFYGINAAKVKEFINVELPTVEVSNSGTDLVFLLEDDTYLHFEFQSTYNKKDIFRFAMYDLRLYERDGRDVVTVIVYSSEVKTAETGINIGSLRYSPEKVMMLNFDGDTIYQKLEKKLNDNVELTEVDMMNLIFLPLMSHSVPKEDLAVKSVELAQTIPDRTKREACTVAAVAFASRYLDEEKIKGLMEVLKMPVDIAGLLVKDAVIEQTVEIARKLLEDNVPVGTIVKSTGLDEQAVLDIQSELSPSAVRLKKMPQEL